MTVKHSYRRGKVCSFDRLQAQAMPAPAPPAPVPGMFRYLVAEVRGSLQGEARRKKERAKERRAEAGEARTGAKGGRKEEVKAESGAVLGRWSAVAGVELGCLIKGQRRGEAKERERGRGIALKEWGRKNLEVFGGPPSLSLSLPLFPLSVAF